MDGSVLISSLLIMTEKIIKNLRQSVSRKLTWTVNIILPLMVCVLLFASISFIHFANIAASRDGMVFCDFLSSYFSDVDFNRMYSGHHILAYRFSSKAILYLMGASYFFTLWVLSYLGIRQRKQLLRYIEGKANNEDASNSDSAAAKTE